MVASFPGNILILTGPTGSGKTQLGIELAERLGAEIISMDSMALYRRMDIGTAKPNRAEQARVRHHLLDVLEPWESASVAWWLEQAAANCRDIARRGKRILLVGGTPLYLKALLCGIFKGPGKDETIRWRLEAEAQTVGVAALHQRLAGIDAIAAARIHAHDLRRVIRALEVWELTGQPISAWQQQWQRDSRSEEQELAPGACVWLDRPRQELYERINQRVEAMFADGLIEEAKALRELPRPLSREAGQALAYKEVFAYLEGCATKEQAIELVKTRTRQYAKRQITWFRHLPGCRPISWQLTGRLWSNKMESGEG